MIIPNKLHNLFKCLLLLTPALLLQHCYNKSKGPDVSHISVDVQLLRFDQDLFAIDTAQVQQGMIRMTEKYPVMMPLFASEIIHDRTNPNETPLAALSGFLKAESIRHLYDSVQAVYHNLDWLEADLDNMFRYYRYYFPNKAIPQVVTIVSEFATEAFTVGDSLCGIGLDMFLGDQFSGYNPEIFPAFVRRQFNKPYIPVRLARALGQNASDEPGGKRLLDLMLFQGKILYVASCLLPNVPDSMIMGYTAQDMAGCYANEQGVWARLLEQNLLYSSDYGKFRKLVEPSPNAPIVFQEAPGEIGNWIGWQIVKSYMARHPGTDMQKMLNLTDSQQFLEAAKYKPKRL